MILNNTEEWRKERKHMLTTIYEKNKTVSGSIGRSVANDVDKDNNPYVSLTNFDSKRGRLS